jgi:hypothetical protein
MRIEIKTRRRKAAYKNVKERRSGNKTRRRKRTVYFFLTMLSIAQDT